MSCISNNDKRYISFPKNVKLDEYIVKKCDETKTIMYEIKILDSFAFMSSSLESLSNNLRSFSDDVNELR